MAFQQIDSLNDAQIDDLVRLYQGEWWTKERTRGDVEKMLHYCDVVIAFCESESGKLVGFARVLTDYVYKAIIFDVIADEAYRGQGLGRTLMDAVVSYPDLQHIVSLELYCVEEMLPFYEKWGFTELTTAKDGQRFCFMRRRN